MSADRSERRYRDELAGRSAVWELSLLVRKGRYHLDGQVDEWDSRLMVTAVPLKQAPITIEIARRRVAEVSHGDPADAFLVADSSNARPHLGHRGSEAPRPREPQHPLRELRFEAFPKLNPLTRSTIFGRLLVCRYCPLSRGWLFENWIACTVSKA